jgi:5-methylcytosine-specific restriction endonuclease McrA
MTSALGDAAGSGSRSNGVDGSAPEQPSLDDQEFTPQASSPSPIPVSQYPRVSPLSPGRFALQLTMSQGTHDKLRRAQALLGHAIPSGEIAEVIDRALDALIANLERRKFGATDNPRDTRPTSSPRHIPARVRRAVRTRDKGQCTYVSHDGHRCEARTRLEYDHEVPLARGGKTSISNLRLRCRAHNQLEAERTFGAGFMEEKRKTARPPATLPTRHALPCTKAKNSSP